VVLGAAVVRVGGGAGFSQPGAPPVAHRGSPNPVGPGLGPFLHARRVGLHPVRRLGIGDRDRRPGWEDLPVDHRARLRHPGETSLVRTDWPRFGFDLDHTSDNVYENVLSQSNVGSLAVSWKAPTCNQVDSSPAIADGLVFVRTLNGQVYALRANGCGAASCSPIWIGQTNGAIYSSPAVADGMVFIGSNVANVYAFPESCTTPCAPLWALPREARFDRRRPL